MLSQLILIHKKLLQCGKLAHIVLQVPLDWRDMCLCQQLGFFTAFISEGLTLVWFMVIQDFILAAVPIIPKSAGRFCGIALGLKMHNISNCCAYSTPGALPRKKSANILRMFQNLRNFYEEYFLSSRKFSITLRAR